MNCRSRTLLAGIAAGLILSPASLPVRLHAQTAKISPKDGITSPEHGGIVFTGSSIFQFWTHLREQMATLPVLNRAIAGTVTQDMLNRIGQLVLQYQPRIVVYYCGSNDISVGEDADPIIERTKRYVRVLHERLPNTYLHRSIPTYVRVAITGPEGFDPIVQFATDEEPYEITERVRERVRATLEK